MPGVVELSEESNVTGVEVILLISGRLHSDGEVMASVLPGEIVVVVESIVGKDLRVGLGSDVADLTETIAAHILPREAGICLGKRKRNADLLVTVCAKDSRGIAGVAVVPTHTGEAEPKLIDDGR